jgi:hypothetical protein
MHQEIHIPMTLNPLPGIKDNPIIIKSESSVGTYAYGKRYRPCSLFVGMCRLILVLGGRPHEYRLFITSHHVLGGTFCLSI